VENVHKDQETFTGNLDVDFDEDMDEQVSEKRAGVKILGRGSEAS